MSLKEDEEMAEEASLGVLVLMLLLRVKDSSSRGGGNVENAQFAFSKEEGKSPILVFGDFPSSVISTALSGCRAKLLKEFALGLLHALRGLGIAEGCGHALQDG